MKERLTEIQKTLDKTRKEIIEVIGESLYLWIGNLGIYGPHNQSR